MKRSVRIFAVSAVVGLAVLAVADAPAHAQPPPRRAFMPPRSVPPTAPTVLPSSRRPVYVPPPVLINPNPYITPTLTLQQAAYNIRVLGSAYASLPPWMYGYNPYVTPYLNYGPTYPPINYTPTPYLTPGLPYNTNPYLFYNPYYAALGYFP